jgi:hypothetical protein
MIYLFYRIFPFDIGPFRYHFKIFVTTHVVRLKLFRLKAEGVRRARLRRERLRCASVYPPELVPLFWDRLNVENQKDQAAAKKER